MHRTIRLLRGIGYFVSPSIATRITPRSSLGLRMLKSTYSSTTNTNNINTITKEKENESPIATYLSVMKAYENITTKGHLLGEVVMGIPMPAREYDGCEGDKERTSECINHQKETTRDVYERLQKNNKLGNGKYNPESYATFAKIKDLLSEIDFTSSFCCGGKDFKTNVNLSLQNKNLGEIENIKIEEIKKMCSPAPYGDYKNMQTKVDKNVRTALECNRFDLKLKLNQIRKLIDNTLNFGRDVILTPYKLNIYEPGGFFKEHVDTPVKPGSMIGSLVVCLPFEHEGGELVVSHGGKSQTFGFSKNSNSPNCFQWAAFYSDCIHEVKPVTKGTRVTVTYLIESLGLHPEEQQETEIEKRIRKEKEKEAKYREDEDENENEDENEEKEEETEKEEEEMFVRGPELSSAGKISKLVETINELPDSIQTFGLFLSHKYTSTAIDYETLKGSDKLKIDALSKNWDYHLTPVIFKSYATEVYAQVPMEKSGHVYAFSMEEMKYLNDKGEKQKYNYSKVPFVMGSRQGHLLSRKDAGIGDDGGNEYSPIEQDSVYYHAAVILSRKK